MDASVIGVFIPIIISLGAFMMVWGMRYLQNKENMAMIERGIAPEKRKHRTDPTSTLRNGLMFLGAGTGLLLAIIITKTFGLNDKWVAVYFALIAMFGGLGMLSAYLYERKNPPGPEE